MSPVVGLLIQEAVSIRVAFVSGMPRSSGAMIVLSDVPGPCPPPFRVSQFGDQYL